MPKIVPLSSKPTTAPSGVVAASLATLSPGEVLWIEGRVTAGSVGLRPYYFAPQADSSTGYGGAWIPLGGDAVAGSSPVKFDVTVFAGCANGRYDYRRAGASVVLVEENAVGVTYDFVHVSTELSANPV